jgi:hypothetical protein
MASGHVNRTQRPNTWLHRPTLRREDSPCQHGAVHTWPITTDIALEPNVGFRDTAEVRVSAGQVTSWLRTTREGEPRCDGRYERARVTGSQLSD